MKVVKTFACMRTCQDFKNERMYFVKNIGGIWLWSDGMQCLSNVDQVPDTVLKMDDSEIVGEIFRVAICSVPAQVEVVKI